MALNIDSIDSKGMFFLEYDYIFLEDTDDLII